jgi:hypothetical protein
MLFPFGPEQPCIKQYSAAHRIRKIHRTAITNVMYRRVRILIITTQYREWRPGGSSASIHQSDFPPDNHLVNIVGLATTVAPGVGMVGWPGLERGEKESKPEGQGPPAARGRAAGVALETVRNPISTILSSSLATLGLDLRGRTIGAVDIEPLSTPTTAYSHLELPSALVENVLIPAPICNVAERTPRSAKSHE